MEKVIRTTIHENGGVHVGTNHNILGYPDDIAIFGINQKDIERLTKTLIWEEE